MVSIVHINFSFFAMFSLSVSFVLAALLQLSKSQAATESFVSRPDLKPVSLLITQPPSASFTNGLYFTTPVGSAVPQIGGAIYTSQGDLVWSNPAAAGNFASDLRPQTLNGTDVLTFWSGAPLGTGGAGTGKAIIFNNEYQQIFSFTTNLPTGTDMHEFTIPTTTNSTAILSSYDPRPADLSSVGGPVDGWIYDCFFEEVNVATSDVLFKWNATAHVNPSDSMVLSQAPSATSSNSAWDFFHINSIDKDADGNYLVSSRHMQSIYKVDGTTGDIIWTLGGKTGQFEFGPNVEFWGQHDVRWVTLDSVISMFDDGSITQPEEPTARGLILNVDVNSFSVTVQQQLFAQMQNTTASQGSNRLNSDGNRVVGWGANPWITEHQADGTRIYEAALGGADLGNQVESYRVFKSFTWKGFPQAPPDVGVNSSAIFASWNGATEVATWKLFAGTKADDLDQIASVPKTGFETAISLNATVAFAQVSALDTSGKMLGQSAVIARNGTTVAPGSVASA